MRESVIPSVKYSSSGRPLRFLSGNAASNGRSIVADRVWRGRRAPAPETNRDRRHDDDGCTDGQQATALRWPGADRSRADARQQFEAEGDVTGGLESLPGISSRGSARRCPRVGAESRPGVRVPHVTRRDRASRTALIVSAALGAANALCPSASRTARRPARRCPIVHRPTRRAPARATCTGTVPTSSPGSVPTARVTVSRPSRPSGGVALAIPKSRIFSRPSVETNRLSGLRSRCTMPRSWAAARPRAICAARSVA